MTKQQAALVMALTRLATTAEQDAHNCDPDGLGSDESEGRRVAKALEQLSKELFRRAMRIGKRKGSRYVD